jgi:hypothetical protein
MKPFSEPFCTRVSANKFHTVAEGELSDDSVATVIVDFLCSTIYTITVERLMVLLAPTKYNLLYNLPYDNQIITENLDYDFDECVYTHSLPIAYNDGTPTENVLSDDDTLMENGSSDNIDIFKSMKLELAQLIDDDCFEAIVELDQPKLKRKTECSECKENLPTIALNL